MRRFWVVLGVILGLAVASALIFLGLVLGSITTVI